MRPAFLFFFFLVSISAHASSGLTFEPNKGQTDFQVQYLARTANGAVFITENDIVLHNSADQKPTIHIAFPGSDAQTSWQPEGPTGKPTHYFIGRDPSRWIRGLPSYQKLVRKNLYPGIDLVLYGNGKNQLEYDLVVAPHADPSLIRLRTTKGAKIDPQTGDLIVSPEVRQHKPILLQGSRQIAGHFRQLTNGDFGFSIGNYDRTKPLVIDPVIESRRYLGGIGDDTINTVGESSFSPYSGTTSSIDFPNTQPNLHHGTDLFYTGNFGTFIVGGTGDETAAPGQFEIFGLYYFVAGTTNSRDLPTFPGAKQQDYAGGASDGFVVAFLTPIVGIDVTYLGTPGDDRILASASNGNTFAAVGTTNGALPNLLNPRPGSSPGGSFDVFVATGTALGNEIKTAVLGGNGDDAAYAVRLTSTGGVVVGGETSSANFPVTAGSYQTQRRGGTTDAFLLRLSNDLAREASTLLGGGSNERINALTQLPDGSIAVCGTTASTDFPSNAPLQRGYGGGASDAFLAVLNPGLTQLVRSTFYGGTGADEALTIASDSTASLFVGGKTSSRDLVLADANQLVYGGGASDGFVLRYANAGISLPYASYFGGSGDDEVLAINANQSPVFTIGGVTTSTDLPGPTPAPFEPRRAGTKEGFLASFTTAELRVPARHFAAKSTLVPIRITTGDSARLTSAGRASIRSSDPSRVLVTFTGPEAFAQDTIFWSNNPQFLSPWAECTADNGSAVVTVSIPGFADQTTTVSCVPGELRLTGPSTIALGSFGFGQLAIEVTGADPVTGVREARLPTRSIGNPFPRLFVSTSNPAIAKSTYNRDSDGRDFAQIQAFGYGDFTLTVAASGFASVSQAMKVISPIPVATAPVPVSAGYLIEDKTGTSSFFNLGPPIAIRSTDPSRVLLTVNPNFFPPTASISAQDQFFISALPGVTPGTEVNLEMTYPGVADPVIRTVRFVQPTVASSTGRPSPTSIRLVAQQSAVPDLRLMAGDRRLLLNSGQSAPVVAIINSNPVVATAPAIFSPTNATAGFTITANSTGTAVLRLLVPAGIQLAPELADGLTVVVTPRVLSIQPQVLNIGKDLATYATLSYVARPESGITATCTTASPAIRLSSNNTSPGSNRIDFAGGSFAIAALESQGTATISCTYPGYEPLNFTVNLRPSGFLWSADQLFTSILRPSLRIFPAPLDPLTGLPLAVGILRFGVTALPTVGNSNPSVATYLPGEDSATAVRVGQTVLSLVQPAGFSTPAIRQRVQVNVLTVPDYTTRPSPFVRVMVIGKGSITGSVPCTDVASPCSQILGAGTTSATFTAVPAPGFRFDRWLGACSDATLARCTAPTFDGIQVTAVFVADTNGFLFLPQAPCRAVDTRNPAGALAGPALAARTVRNFPLRSACSLPVNAVAYSVNITVVPRGPLGFLTVWPGGQPQPTVSTLNSLDGRVKANAAIVAAGTSGSVDFYATDATDVIVDVNGAFVPRDTPNGQAFYSLDPCRITDTRTSVGAIPGLVTRSIPMNSTNACVVPSGASAYVLNVTAIPKRSLGFLTMWPSGIPRPTVSTLNAVTGAVTANMAIVPAGTFGNELSAYVTEDADLVIDIAGYFARPGQPNALLFHPVAPCRALDTRLGNAGEIPAAGFRDIPVPCGTPQATVRAYAVNATVVPSSVLGYLTLFPTAVTRPITSTLNAADGALTSNAAIVSAGLNGAISAYVTERTHLILDITGYFAP